jgi:hypothetical protein
VVPKALSLKWPERRSERAQIPFFLTSHSAAPSQPRGAENRKSQTEEITFSNEPVGENRRGSHQRD